MPTDRLKFEMQEKALRVVCTASRNGTEPVDAEKMAGLLNLSPATAPLNNAFFVSVGLMEKAGKGEYLPTAPAIAYQQKWSFDKKAAPALLTGCFVDTWFFEAVQQKLAVGPTTRDQMIETLASVAHTDNSYSTQYGSLLDWLEYVGLIRLTDGMVTLGVEPLRVEPPDEPEVRDSANTGNTGNVDTQGDGKPDPEVDEKPPERRESPAVLSIAFSIDVTADDLARLSGEQITALFEGAGKLAAVRAALS